MQDVAGPARRFDEVVREHGAALARLAAVYAAEPADRDDLLQEIWVALWRALPRFRGECSLRTFVYRVGHNRGLTFRARQRRNPSAELPPTLADPRPGPDAELARSRRHERLLDAVRRLPEPQRQAVTLSLEGLSHAEIAEVVGTTENNVAVRLSRGRAALRELLEAGG
ncbi:MAG TPA: sigma-70 family RNA polymerase sigma factor [Longimicrobium sp.]